MTIFFLLMIEVKYSPKINTGQDTMKLLGYLMSTERTTEDLVYHRNQDNIS